MFGAGGPGRPFERVSRNSLWHKQVAQIPSYDIEIVARSSHRREMFRKKARLIAELLPSCNRAIKRGIRDRSAQGKADRGRHERVLAEILAVPHAHRWQERRDLDHPAVGQLGLCPEISTLSPHACGTNRPKRGTEQLPLPLCRSAE
jgi:hypothetical protein